MSPLTSMPALPSPVKRSACTARAVSTRARMVDDDSPPSRLASLSPPSWTVPIHPGSYLNLWLP